MDSVPNSSTGDYLTIRYALAGTFAVYIYEYILTFGDEVRLVWHSRMSLIKALFFVNRYLPFSFTALAAYTYILNPEDSMCRRLFTALTLLSATGVIFAETVLAMRVYIIWESSRRILCGLVLIILTGIVGGYYGTVRYIDRASVSKLDVFSNGCVVRTDNRTSEEISYGLILLYELFVLVLMLIKVLRHRTTRSLLMRVAYGDSVFYCIFILLITISNLVLLKFESEILCHLLLLPQATLHNILCNRLLLRLRSANTSLAEEGFLSIHVSGGLDSLVLSDLGSRSSTL